LIDGGVDLILIETIFATLNQSRFFAVQQCLKKNISLPVMI
jgi:methionine synthase I (cobalamin-dependent)